MSDPLERLSHPAATAASGPIAVLFQTVLTLGLLPLVLWPARWADFLQGERRDLLGLISGWRRRVDARHAGELDKIVGRLRPRPMLMVLPWLAAGFNAFVIGALLLQGDSPRRIFQLTVQHDQLTQTRSLAHWHGTDYYPGRNASVSAAPTWVDTSVPAVLPLEKHLFPIWMFGLGLGYLFHWYAVRSHAVTVNTFVKWTNKLAREKGFAPVRAEVLRVGLNPLWIIVGLFLIVPQVWWAIPLIFAGSMQNRYMTRSSPALRIALAEQARQGFPLVHDGFGRFCHAETCGARIPEQARFCPRCGAAV